MMLNFDAELPAGHTVRHSRGCTAQKLFMIQSTWDWRTLREYVVFEIEARTGPWQRDLEKEYGIFSSFLKRWGPRAEAIARFSFEINGGIHFGDPIRIATFCKANDPYFAAVINARIDEASEFQAA